MKRTQLIELLANIRKTFVSFFSIVMFVALGVGVFQGIYWSGPGLQASAEHVYDEQAFHDFQIQFPYGLTEGDLDELRSLEGITGVEGGYLAYQTADVDGRSKVFKVQTPGMDIDKLEVVDGSLPSKAGQMAVLDDAAGKLGIEVGDRVSFKHDADQADAEPDEDGMATLTTSDYEVTALVKSPEYIAVETKTYGLSTTPTGSVDALAWVDPKSFDADALFSGYNLVSVACDSLRGNVTLGSRYATESSEIESGIVALGETLSKKRFDAIHADAQKEIEDAQKELEEARGQIADGERQLADAKSELASARSQVASGTSQLASAKKKLASGESQVADAKAKLDKESASAKKDLDEAKAQLDAGKSEYETNAASLAEAKTQYEAMKAAGELTPEEIAQAEELIPQYEAKLAQSKEELDAAQKEYDKAKSSYDTETASARRQIAAKEAELESARATIWSKESQLQTARNQIATAEVEIPQKEADLEEAKEELAKNESKLDDARARLDDMREYGWSVSSRTGNGSVAQIKMVSEMTNHLSYSMAALFLIVGLLVSYSAVSRLVREQVRQIGTKKALGLRSHEITRSFLAYSALAVVAGVIIGFLASIFVVQAIIADAFARQFTIGELAPYFTFALLGISTLLEIVLVLGTTWLACRSILRKNAVDLLRGEDPPKSKGRFFEKWKVWERLPLFTQTMVNNCLNDKRRVFSTLVGVAGCTALVVTAITLNDNVMKSYDLQYDNVYGFNAIAYSDPDVDGSLAKTAAALDEEGLDYAHVTGNTFSAQVGDGDKSPLRLIVPGDDSGFDEFYRVNPVRGDAIDLAADGVWLTRAYAAHKNADIGDKLAVENAEGERYELPILGFYEYYLSNEEAVMGKAAYERVFGEAAAPNELLVNTRGRDLEELEGQLSNIEGFYQLQDDQTAKRLNFDAFSSISRAVVLIYLVLSVLMAIVVLLNLNFMFIDEKKRELIVLMINGYTSKQARRYISNDTIVLTVMGIVLGLVVGAVMGAVTVASIEPSNAVFFKGIDWRAIVAAIVVSGLLSFIMSSISLRRIPRFKLTDINR